MFACHLDAHVPTICISIEIRSTSHTNLLFSLSVVDYAFHRATQPQKRQLLLELYSTELQLFKDLTVQSSCRLIRYTSWNPGLVFWFFLLFIFYEHLFNSGNKLELSMFFPHLFYTFIMNFSTYRGNHCNCSYHYGFFFCLDITVPWILFFMVNP